MTAPDGDAAWRAAACPPAIADRIAPERVFELPPPTASRLTLAQLALGAAALFAASWFLVFRAGVAGAADCTTQAATTARYLACTKRAFTEEGWLLLAGPVALAVLASVGWLAAPAVLTRWRAVVSIPDGPVRSALDALACESGERRAPQWCTGSVADAWTFGRSPRYRVVLARAMVRRMRREGPAPLRAVVLHELGHLRNRDVDQTYVTLCGIVVFGMFIAVPLAVDAVVMGWALGLSLGWRLLALVALVLLTGAAALRSRERDADLRAAVTDRAAVVAAVRASAARRARTPRRSRGWRSPLRLHPDDALRLAAVEDPGRAMTVSWPEFLAAGVAAGVVLVETPSVLQDLFGAGPTSQYAVAGWLTALPLARVVGLGAWRSAAVSTHPRLVLPGVALGAGLVLGSQLAPRSSATWQAIFATARDREFSPALDDVAPTSAVWLVGLALMIGVLWTTPSWRAQPSRSCVPGPVRRWAGSLSWQVPSRW